MRVIKALPITIKEDGTILRDDLPEVTSAFLDQVHYLASEGFTQRDLAAYYRVAPKDWLKLMQDHQIIEKIADQGKAEGLRFATQCLSDLMIKGNPKAVFFCLTHVHKWSNNPQNGSEASFDSREKKELPRVSSLTIDQIEASRIYQQLMSET